MLESNSHIYEKQMLQIICQIYIGNELLRQNKEEDYKIRRRLEKIKVYR